MGEHVLDIKHSKEELPAVRSIHKLVFLRIFLCRLLQLEHEKQRETDKLRKTEREIKERALRKKEKKKTKATS